MIAVDRQTGVRCPFPQAAFHMLSSIWYEHDYDIPDMPIREGDVVIDIGANHGFFACYAASKGAPTLLRRDQVQMCECADDSASHYSWMTEKLMDRPRQQPDLDAPPGLLPRHGTGLRKIGELAPIPFILSDLRQNRRRQLPVPPFGGILHS